MHYIINPWVFYLLDVIGNLDICCGIILAVFAVVLFIYALVWFIDGESWEEKYISPMQILKKFKVLLIIVILANALIPSEDTIYKMLIASQVTAENIGTAKETIQDVADYIVDAVKEIKEKEDD